LFAVLISRPYKRDPSEVVASGLNQVKEQREAAAERERLDPDNVSTS
jgi:hypothetical protein